MQLRKMVVSFAAGAVLGLTGCTSGIEAPDTVASFNWFEYRGQDALFEQPLAEGQYQNPIVAGFYPDPSVTRAGDDFFMTHSSFAFFPGLPILHSTDLVNWRPLGHALTRPEQVDMEGLGVSRGIFAPTIRYHEGTFYIITTAVDAGGNFLITATDPAGPWSDPIWLPEVGGIDPDIFFDDDGRIYIAHNDAPEGEPLYEGHRAIWLWEYDPEAKAVITDSGRVIVNGGTDLSKQPIWIEAPHIYKKDGWYYLSCAEGGTGYNHSQVVFRARSLQDPFVPYENNPILTQRDLDIDRADPITTAGHADFVKTPTGEWWAVFLATRAYDQTLYNTGRETFLLPVTWENEWPHILPQGEAIPYRHRQPADLPRTPDAEPMTGNFVWRDDFQGEQLSPIWNMLRTDGTEWFGFVEGTDALSLKALPVSLADSQQPAFLGRRQQHMKFAASTSLDLPLAKDMSAGLTAFQNETHHYYLGVQRQGHNHAVFLEKAEGSAPEVITRQLVEKSLEDIVLGVEGQAGSISFYYEGAQGERFYIAEDIDARLLSTERAGGFVGTHLGLHSRADSVEE